MLQLCSSLFPSRTGGCTAGTLKRNPPKKNVSSVEPTRFVYYVCSFQLVFNFRGISSALPLCTHHTVVPVAIPLPVSGTLSFYSMDMHLQRHVSLTAFAELS